MRILDRRHLGKAIAGAAVAATATAVMVAVTLPGEASGSQSGTASAARQGTVTGQGGDTAGPAVVEDEPRQGPRGAGRDPLTDDELRRAERIATTGTFRADGENVHGKPGPQPLAADLAELSPREAASANPPRRAEVRYYDYEDDTYITRTVDLDSGKVERTDTQRGVQPPPSGEEVREAARLLIADPLGSGLKQDYRDATGKELTGPGQLTVTGFVYRVDAENPGPARLAECGEHRCVRLFTRVVNGPWIDVRQLVIDLSDRTVARL
ncbi:Tat pathway signal sequence domain protein [Streptomyces pactum]|uniref:Tat pathway signal sequence domain protein n=1 Tax=Streptomyces pactum TaxID=68249 RepID=A0ABS0NQN9_9ACTN|nr:Tat pathway signal sequence domain protein [Streptomyces pactum]MBH5337524.1 Tat pathway signal sequence domain protein [Streptomyces pactum]